VPSHTPAPPNSSMVEEVVHVEAGSGSGGALQLGMGWKISMASPQK
jgi:nitrogen fixation protein